MSRVSRSPEPKVSTKPVATAGVVSSSPVSALTGRIIPALGGQHSDPATLAAVVMTSTADAVRGRVIKEWLALHVHSNIRNNLIKRLGLVNLEPAGKRHLESTDHSQCRVIAGSVWILLCVVEANDLSHQSPEANNLLRLIER